MVPSRNIILGGADTCGVLRQLKNYKGRYYTGKGIVLGREENWKDKSCVSIWFTRIGIKKF